MKIESLEDLRVLVETARGGTLTAASRVLGERLFERSTRAMRLTAEGETLLDYATRALELLQEGEAQVANQARSLVGTVRVAAPSDLTRSVLLPWFDAFVEANPGVKLALTVTDRVQDVMRDAVDVALRYGTLSDSRLAARTLATTRRVPCAAPAYLKRHKAPRTPEDLAQHNCLTFHLNHRRYTAWRFEKDGQWTEVRVEGDRDADDAAIAHQWAVAGAGIVYKSELDLVHDLREGRLVRLLPGWGGEHYPLNAVLPSNRFVPARVRALVDFLADRFAQLAAQKPGKPAARGLKR